jgi:hypothetical protein
MTSDALSPHMTGAPGQKPTALKTSPISVIGALLLAGCGTSPIEAVVSDEVSATDPTFVPSTGAAACDEPAAGRFTLSVANACLRRGEMTTVFGTEGFMTELSTDCATPRAQWDLTPSVAGSFTLRNVEDQLSLDVRTGSDVPGTPIIIYDPNTLDNQRFWFRPRASKTYELAPRHAPSLCAEARPNGLEIWPCQTDDADQAFRFARVSCP